MSEGREVDAEDLLRMPEAADIAGVSTRELLSMVDRGEVEAVTERGVLLVRRADAEALRP